MPKSTHKSQCITALEPVWGLTKITTVISWCTKHLTFTESASSHCSNFHCTNQHVSCYNTFRRTGSEPTGMDACHRTANIDISSCLVSNCTWPTTNIHSHHVPIQTTYTVPIKSVQLLFFEQSAYKFGKMKFPQFSRFYRPLKQFFPYDTIQ